MIHLHCTKKLLSALPLDETGGLINRLQSRYSANDEAATPLDHWHANLITMQRRKCILFVHDETRFPVFVPALKKTDFGLLDRYFADSFLNTLLKTGADDALMEQGRGWLSAFACDSICDRSVLGTLNRMATEIDYMLAYNSVSVADITGYRVGAWLADSPCRVKKSKDIVWPGRRMHGILRRSS